MTAAASPLSIAGTALSGFGKIGAGIFGSEAAEQQGQQQAQMDEFEAQRQANAQQYGMAQAAQTDSDMRLQLMRTLGNIAAVRASSGDEGGSPTDQAIMARTQGQGDQQREITVGNLTAQAAESGQESQMYTTAAQQTLQASSTNALASLFGGVLGGLGSTLTGVSPTISGLLNNTTNTSLPNNKNGGLLGFG